MPLFDSPCPQSRDVRFPQTVSRSNSSPSSPVIIHDMLASVTASRSKNREEFYILGSAERYMPSGTASTLPLSA